MFNDCKNKNLILVKLVGSNILLFIRKNNIYDKDE